MTEHHDLDARLAAFLTDGMDRLPDRAVDAVLDEIHDTRQRTVFGPWRISSMNSAFKFAAVAAGVAVVAFAGAALIQRGGGVGEHGPAAPAPSASASPSPSPSLQASRMKVAGSNWNGTSSGGAELQLTVALPAGWHVNGDYAASNDASNNLSGADKAAFFVSVPDNTFADPCVHTQRTPKLQRNVADVAAAIGQIPSTSATAAVQTTLGGRPATFIDLHIPASPPCSPGSFYLWQDSPGNDWWALRAGEEVQAWIVNVAGQPVVVAGRSFPDTGTAVKAELEQAVQSIAFQVPASPQPASPSPSR